MAGEWSGRAQEPAEWEPTALDAAPDAVIAIDDEGRITRVNRAAEKLFELSREEIEGRPVDTLLVTASEPPGAPHQLLDAPLDNALDMSAVRPGGERSPVEVTLARTGEPPIVTAFVRPLSREDDPHMARLLAAAEHLAHIGSWELDLRSGHAVWTDEMYRIHGHEPGSVEPGVEMLLGFVHRDDSEHVRTILRGVTERPAEVPAAGVVAEYRAVRPDATVRTVRFHGRVERDAGGEPARWVGTAQDVTDQRLTERELHAHYAVGQALRDWESFDEGVVVLLRRLGTALDLPMGSLWTCHGPADRLNCRAFWRAPDVDAGEFEPLTRSTSFSLGQGVPGRVWETGETMIVPEISTLLDYRRRAAAQEIGLRSGIAFAAGGEEGTLATLSFYSFDRRVDSPRLARTLTGIGRELGRFLTSRRADLGPGKLSGRELEVLNMAAEGNSGPAIASRLTLSPGTVKTHFENIYEKLGVSDRAAAVAHALRVGLIR
jgi:PAS domain S-box-containing protein